MAQIIKIGNMRGKGIIAIGFIFGLIFYFLGMHIGNEFIVDLGVFILLTTAILFFIYGLLGAIGIINRIFK
ncbi:hypothetical protein MJ1_0593 [Nanobdella aerobiophila]|uniref:Uncharacterized protein n=1 Tax=Nanobdella aerobiophila TaxID=2586965 RepID=A0A915SKM6_9ARCH|nr:hypothetical protein [Nanobdella aerobiophila]BBL45743.1 hypothetical protein MJ1_0593 [Nanobdella aerobiophila]